jgi:hypothetical protein
MYVNIFLGEKDTDESTAGRGCWSWRTTKKHHQGRALVRRRPTLIIDVEHTHQGAELDTNIEEDNHGEMRSGTVWRR